MPAANDHRASAQRPASPRAGAARRLPDLSALAKGDAGARQGWLRRAGPPSVSGTKTAITFGSTPNRTGVLVRRSPSRSTGRGRRVRDRHRRGPEAAHALLVRRRSGDQRRHEGHKVGQPSRSMLQTSRNLVIWFGVGGDRHAATEIAPIADRELQRFHLLALTIMGQLGGEGPGAAGKLGRLHGIGERAEALLGLLVHRLRDPHRKADAGDVEEVLVVGGPDIDDPHEPRRDRRDRGRHVGRNAERAGKVVRRAHGNDAERQAGLDQGRCRRVHRAVAAGHHDRVHAVLVAEGSARASRRDDRNALRRS